MKVRILKTSAGPDGVFLAGQVGDWPRDVIAGLEYQVLEADPEPEVVEAAVTGIEVETAAVDVVATPRRGRPPRGTRK